LIKREGRGTVQVSALSDSHSEATQVVPPTLTFRKLSAAPNELPSTVMRALPSSPPDDGAIENTTGGV